MVQRPKQTALYPKQPFPWLNPPSSKETPGSWSAMKDAEDMTKSPAGAWGSPGRSKLDPRRSSEASLCLFVFFFFWGGASSRLRGASPLFGGVLDQGEYAILSVSKGGRVGIASPSSRSQVPLQARPLGQTANYRMDNVHGPWDQQQPPQTPLPPGLPTRLGRVPSQPLIGALVVLGLRILGAIGQRRRVGR